ncbi:Choline dehydrogenase [Mycolicibacterium rhodesiae JS60]|nr:Choline dehydrogenase [Mycolicibacterium rhodesiae JS60]
MNTSQTVVRRTIIVVGAGTAGCVIAARLSEDPDTSVILLEAGQSDDYGEEILDPRLAHNVWLTQSNTKLTLMAAPSGPIPMIQGHITGGTSAVNYLATVRGQPEDYDAWEAMGLPGWGWSDVLSYFIAAENDRDFGATPIHGGSGPLTVSRWKAAEHSPFQAAFADGLRQVGVPQAADANDPSQLPGIAVFPATLNSARQRMTTSTAYLTDSVRSRPNLDIRPSTSAARIQVESGRAVGVVTSAGDQLRADEVVVAAGAIGSPTLLLRSGIGPREQLMARGIEVHADLPVGSTMSDHLGTAIPYRHEGPRTLMGGPAQPVLIGASDGSQVDYHVFPTPSPTYSDDATFLMLALLLKSTGRGSVTLDDDPEADPVVTAPPLPDDAHTRLGHAFRTIAEWEQSPAAIALGCKQIEAHDLTAPEAVQEALARLTMSYGHMVGTCPMGSVLDARGRVNGIDGLRVADAASMPMIPAGNTYLGCVMIAERIAGLMTRVKS